MNERVSIEPILVEAIASLNDYITQMTGVKPTQKELADALMKYFVLKEIREFIEMSRADSDSV